jgi:RHS repeat-associated protein
VGCVAPLGPTPTPVDDELGYDARGNLVALRNADIGLVREYDALGRLVREIDDRVGTGVGYVYDRAGRITSKVLPDGTTMQLSYDPAGRIVGLADPFGDLTQLRYDAAGRTIGRASRASALRTAFAYDGLGRLSRVDGFRADGSVASYASYPLYDDAGNRLEKQTGADTTAYEYDELHRLVRESVSGETDTRYAYSASGDRLQGGEHDGVTFTSAAFGYAYRSIGALPTHQLESAANGLGESRSFAYNQNGEVYQWSESGAIGTRTITRDALGRIVAISGAGFSGSYAYDPLGRRIEKLEQGERTLYQHDGDQVVAEYSAVNTLEAIYVFGPGLDQPLKIRRGATVAAYHADGLGSIEAVTDLSTSADLARYEYDAFGVVVSESTSFDNAYSYTGRERDQSGLYYYRSRYYLPEIGRFLSPDPAGLRGGINAYAYVGSNPVNFIDPFGLEQGLYQIGAPPGFGDESQSGASELRVVTEIRPPDQQAGMKSTQVAVVDRNSGELLSTGHKTGVTKLFGSEFGSRGDAFSANVRRTSDSLIVDMTGETASKLFPFWINYDLDLRFDPRSGSWSVTGTHDGYPSYVVTADGVVVYEYQQGSIGELLGCCDVEVGR